MVWGEFRRALAQAKPLKNLKFFSSFCIGRKFCVNTYWHRVGKDIQQLPKSDKGIRDLKACLYYSYHHARSYEFEFLLPRTSSLAIRAVILRSQCISLIMVLRGCLMFHGAKLRASKYMLGVLRWC